MKEIKRITHLPFAGLYYMEYLMSEKIEDRVKNLEKEREIISNLFGEDNKSMNNRNYFDLYEIYT